MRQSTVPISTVRICRARIRTQGALSNYKNLPIQVVEPDGHGIGRSRGGLTTKVHYAVDGNGRPIAVAVTGGQRNDGAMLQTVLEEIRVPRLVGGAARTRPDHVLADKAYATGVNRGYLRGRRIGAVIPEKTTEISSRKRKGSRGGRPPKFDSERYKDRNVVEFRSGLASR